MTRIRRAVTLLLSVAVAGAAALIGTASAGAAEASYPAVPYRISYGNTYSDGNVTFTNRGVIVSGEQKSVSSSDCRFTAVQPFRADGVSMNYGRYSKGTCGRSEKFSVSVPAGLPGGAAYAVVTFYAGLPDKGDSKRLGEVTVRNP